MKIYGKIVAIAAVISTLPIFVIAQTTSNATQNTAGQHTAMQLVSVKAAFTQGLDAKQVHNGSEIRVKLTGTAHLTDGTKLPSGTILIGHVVQGDSQESGRATLALLFDQAELKKDGKVIPIKVTIVGLAAPASNPDTMIADDWSQSILAVDQIDALPGVDLHSQIDSRNSGVLVATKKDDVRLTTGSQLELAVGPQAAQSGL